MAIRFMSNSETAIDYSSLKALVVDDIPGMRSALKMTLANFGVTKSDVASTAQEAIGRLSNGSYDLVLCDYNLGEARDGQLVYARLYTPEMIGARRDPKRPAVVFVHVPAGVSGPSSATPLQSLSIPSHTSDDGSSAVHPVQPAAGSQRSKPWHIPRSFSRAHARSSSAFAGPHEHVSLIGTHCLNAWTPRSRSTHS